ncbi:hypothetical protein [Streptomyces sp. NPDC007856]|uniref:hypothetical protein n=1 Tax=Streptomyces sp. NPDC007856 TaxID=3364781 RepID=UPI003689D584
MGDQDNAVAEERDTGAVGHQAFLQLDVGDAAFVDSGVVQRSRAATLSPEQVEQLSAIGMRWA